MAEFYPMPMFVKLSVSDMERAINWYKNVLDYFESVFELPGNHGKTVMAHLRGNKYQDLMLVSSQTNVENNGQGVVINFLSENVDKVAERAINAGAEIIEGPVNRAWNARELVLRDPNGYIITLSGIVDEKKTFDEVMKHTK